MSAHIRQSIRSIFPGTDQSALGAALREAVQAGPEAVRALDAVFPAGIMRSANIEHIARLLD